MKRKLGSKINAGISAEIFEWGNNERIIKLARKRTDRKAIQREYLNSLVAWNNGLSVPRPFQLLDVNGRLGIVFERIYGETLKELFSNQFLSHSNTEESLKGFNYEDMLRITAKLLSETHRKTVSNMSSQREDIICSIKKTKYLTILEKRLIIDILNKIPVKQQLCHGDLNMSNILVKDKKAILIDWMYASMGNPEADLAEYILMIRYDKLFINISRDIGGYIKSIRENIIKVFIDEYTKLSDITYQDIDAWIIPMAAKRLSCDIIPKVEKELLLGEIRSRLKVVVI